MKKLLLLGGTSEEHELLSALAALPVSVTLCVASEYGRSMLPENCPGMSVRVGRMDEKQLEDVIKTEDYSVVVDATHPYASEVTKNAKAAAVNTGIKYIRLMRAKSETDGAIIVSTVKEAAERLVKTGGNVLLTTGSKELSRFTCVPDYKERLYPRVLPTVESIKACVDSGYPAKHIIAMHGPFSQELNVALIRQFDIKTVVTKDGGRSGGFPEKLGAARETGAEIIVVRRPEDDGVSADEVIRALTELLEGK